MAFANYTSSPGKELLVGSKDNEIRVFQNEQAIEEVVEIDEITGLCPVYGSKFAYALANGTLGLYVTPLSLSLSLSHPIRSTK